MSIESKLTRLARLNPVARALLAFKAEHPRIRETSTDFAAREIKVDRWLCMKAMQAIGETGGGTFKIGRGGYPTRIIWSPETVDYTAVHTDFLSEDVEDEAEEQVVPTGDALMEARALISRAFNVAPEKVRIQIDL